MGFLTLFRVTTALALFRLATLTFRIGTLIGPKLPPPKPKAAPLTTKPKPRPRVRDVISGEPLAYGKYRLTLLCGHKVVVQEKDSTIKALFCQVCQDADTDTRAHRA